MSDAYAQIPPVGIRDEGGAESKPVFTIDCVGDGITCTHNGITGTITVSTVSSSQSCWELDSYLAVQPISASDCTDQYWELDANGALQPKT